MEETINRKGGRELPTVFREYPITLFYAIAFIGSIPSVRDVFFYMLQRQTNKVLHVTNILHIARKLAPLWSVYIHMSLNPAIDVQARWKLHQHMSANDDGPRLAVFFSGCPVIMILLIVSLKMVVPH